LRPRLRAFATGFSSAAFERILAAHPRRNVVFSKVKSVGMSVALIGIVVGSTTSGASAVTAELARKCSALMAKAYPPRQAGNPAAGSAKGNGTEARAYYQKCVANNGKVDDNAGTQANSPGTLGNTSGAKGK
jgi:hypothetical protein